MAASSSIPRSALRVWRTRLGAWHRALQVWQAGLGDRRRGRKPGYNMLAPAHLRDRVHGRPDAEGFMAGGRDAFEAIRMALADRNVPLERCSPLLDFGCGCARTLRWFQWYERLELHGTDIDAEAIAWCRDHVPIASFEVNDALPPLPYADGRFTLVYGISVLTHLDETYQDAWLEELRRVTRPGGYVLLSVHGRGSHHALDAGQRATLQSRGFLFARSTRWDGVFPDWYQNAFHEPGYIRDHFSRFFHPLAHHEGVLGGIQDLVVLRRPS